MQLSSDEVRALAFIAGLIALSVLGRWVDRPKPVLADQPAVDLAELAERSRQARTPDPPRSKATTAPEPPRAPAPVDLNAASAAELERLPGIGPALAGRIVAYRDSVRGFRTVEQLDSVKGVGPALMGRLKPLLRLRE